MYTPGRQDPLEALFYAFAVVFHLVPGRLKGPWLVVHKVVPAVSELWVAHDSNWDLGPAQPLQPLLVALLPVKVQAGGEDPQVQARVTTFKQNQFLGAAWAGAPCEETGDLVALGLVQAQGTDPFNKATFCMVTFLGPKAAFGQQVAVGLLHLVAQVGHSAVVGLRDLVCVVKLDAESSFF